jgi:3-hydroxybutyryl-CoA dehydrogenase
MEIRGIGVVGAGSMGHGIAQVSAQMGCNVILYDIEEKAINRGLKKIDGNLSRAVEKGKIAEDERKAVLGRIKGTTDFQAFEDADFVIEAVFEDLELKQKLFGELDKICRSEVILASNTSSMSITEIAAATSRPDKVVGMHFFNPVPAMLLVEIIRGYLTSDATVKISIDVAKMMKKEYVEVKKDSPGFLVNRILMPYVIEAINIVEQGIATPEDVDKAVKFALNYPMGPFELMDFTGMDVAVNVIDYFFKELNKELKWVCPALLKSMTRAGRYGRKTGSGWYVYDEE